MEAKDNTYTLTDQPTGAPDFVAKLIEQSAKTYHALQPALGKRAALATELAEIETAGWCNASEYWRETDKLILIHPTPRDGGKRVREYIGSDPARIAEARARLARYARRQQLAGELQELDKRLHLALDSLDAFNRALEGKSRWGW